MTIHLGAWYLGLPAAESARQLVGWDVSTVGGVLVARELERFERGPVLVDHDGCLLVGQLALRERAAGPESLIDEYLRSGPGFIAGLTGEFGFAIWDGTGFVVATDKMGMHAVVVAHAGSFVGTASDVDTLRSVSGLSTTPDPSHVTLSIGDPAHIIRSTPHEQIQRLEPGHYGEAHATLGVRMQRYWMPEAGYHSKSVADDTSRLRATLIDSVEQRLGSARRPGAQLSGGLDSSAVVGVLGPRIAEAGGRLRTFSHVLPAGHGDPRGDERPYVEEVLEFVPGVEQCWVETGGELEPQQREDALYRSAAAAGVDVLFSGFGGDEHASFNGRFYLAQLLLHARWITLAREIDLRSTRRHKRRLHIFLSGPVRRATELVVNRARQLAGRDSVSADDLFLTPELARLVDVGSVIRSRPIRLRDPVGDMQRHLFAIYPGARRSAREHLAAREHGLSIAYPLQDPGFVELAFSLPPERWAHDGWHRWIWRMAIEGLVPETVRWRIDKRPPLPGDGDPTRRVARLEHLCRRATSLEPGSLGRQWVNVEAAARVVEADAGRSNRKLAVQGRRARRALEAALALDAEAAASGW